MLENPSSDSSNIKRYTTPSQRNRVLNRRKSGDRFEKGNYSFGIDVDKSQFMNSRNIIPATDYGEIGNRNLSESRHTGLIPLDGCASGEAAQILSDRWAAAINSYNDPTIDLSERPVVYSGASGSAWGHTKLPPQMDFLAELRRQYRNANVNSVTNSADHN